ncbi:MAG TPA: hypothetical protein VG841_14205 [Caulobacterales bacterium]|nr:hypothetical protein [Caulobacterales bacterium]
MFRRLESVLATLGALLLFTLNEMRLFNERPRIADTVHGFTHGAFLRAFGAPEHVYLGLPDLAVRWSLVALTVALSLWALTDSFARAAPAAADKRAP